MANTKQVIVMRKDLKVRKGKLIAQGAHASVGALLSLFEKYESYNKDSKKETTYKLAFDDSSFLEDWLNGLFTKICVYVDSEDELIEIFDRALEAKLPCKLITDAGITEFHDIPTTTCCAIGPYWSEEIDKITKDLSLL